jgi:hypothetical protein
MFSTKERTRHPLPQIRKRLQTFERAIWKTFDRARVLFYKYNFTSFARSTTEQMSALVVS